MRSIVRREQESGRLLAFVQKVAGFFAIGLVRIDDPDYIAICACYRALTYAHQRGDYTSVLTSLDRDYFLVRPDGTRLKRSQVEAELQSRFAAQIESEYREEPAHFVLRGNRAQVASRLHSRTVSRKNGGLVEIQERGESITKWVKTKGGWKRASTRVRSFEQKQLRG